MHLIPNFVFEFVFVFSMHLIPNFDLTTCLTSPACWGRAKSKPRQSLADEALHPRPRIWDGIGHRSVQVGLRCVLPVLHLHLVGDRDLGHVVVLLVKEGAGDRDLRHKRSHFSDCLGYTEWLSVQCRIMYLFCTKKKILC